MVYFINRVINLFLNAIGSMFSLIIGLLPTSPFLKIQDLKIPYLSELNWIIPFNVFVQIIGYLVLAYIGFYVVSSIMKWVKMIS